MICPMCRSEECFRSHREGVADFFATLIQLRPWRCRTCDNRFYAWSVAVSFARYAHCARCGNFNLQKIARDRVDDGTLIFLKRLLGFPAFRCDPCRQKFFSVLPYRKIMPSMVPESSRDVPVA